MLAKRCRVHAGRLRPAEYEARVDRAARIPHPERVIDRGRVARREHGMVGRRSHEHRHGRLGDEGGLAITGSGCVHIAMSRYHPALAVKQLAGPCPVHRSLSLVRGWRLEDAPGVDAEVDVHSGEARVRVPEGSLSVIARPCGRGREGVAEHVTLGCHEAAHPLLLLLGRRHEVRLLAKILVILHGGGGVELGRKLTLSLAGRRGRGCCLAALRVGGSCATANLFRRPADRRLCELTSGARTIKSRGGQGDGRGTQDF